jgi:proton-coupled amino acid transporter
VTDCKTFIPISWMIVAELAIFLPLAMIRNLAKLSGTALVADAFILIGSEWAEQFHPYLKLTK